MNKFWKKVTIKKLESNSFQVMLDEKILKTPLKREFVLPNLKLAQEIVKEWDQDAKNINTDSMIFYSLMATSLDNVVDNKNSYVNDILNYIDTDLVCYRAENPKELVELQKEKWDPIILKIEKYINLKIQTFTGVIPSKQEKSVHIEIAKLINKLNIFEISVLHRITNILGSVFLSLCIFRNEISQNDAFYLSFLDELWQAENWGIEGNAANKRKEISFELNRTVLLLNYL